MFPLTVTVCSWKHLLDGTPMHGLPISQAKFPVIEEKRQEIVIYAGAGCSAMLHPDAPGEELVVIMDVVITHR